MTAEQSRVLITGAAGFIGSHLTRRLIRDGFDVVIIERETVDPWRIEDLLSKVKRFDIDLRDTDGVLKVFSNFEPEVVFHLATFYVVEHSVDEITEMIDTNVQGIINLLEAAKATEANLFVNTSSCFVYKNSQEPLTESSQLEPLNLYALTKIYAEQACSFYSKLYGLKSVTFRLFPPYGPFDHERRLIPYLIRSLSVGERPRMTSGKQSWDYVYVNDIIDAYLCLLNIPTSFRGHEVFNIGGGEPVSARKICQRLKEIIGSNLEPQWGAVAHRKNEVWFMCADISKAKQVLRWRPKTRVLEDGLELTTEWFKRFWAKEEKNGRENN